MSCLPAGETRRLRRSATRHTLARGPCRQPFHTAGLPAVQPKALRDAERESEDRAWPAVPPLAILGCWPRSGSAIGSPGKELHAVDKPETLRGPRTHRGGGGQSERAVTARHCTKSSGRQIRRGGPRPAGVKACAGRAASRRRTHAGPSANGGKSWPCRCEPWPSASPRSVWRPGDGRCRRRGLRRTSERPLPVWRESPRPCGHR